MRATEAGAQVPTGTPGSGLPIPIEPRTPVRPPEAPTSNQMAIGPLPTPSSVAEAVLRAVSNAYCERERRCRRLDEPHTQRCLVETRARYGEKLGSAACPYSFDVDAVVSCLREIRDIECDVPLDDVSILDRCYAPAMCSPR